MSNLDNVKIRILNADEFDRKDLIEIFNKNESLVPNPLVANIQVAENEEGKIVGFAVLQPQYHLEPIYVDEEYRDSHLHKELIEQLLKPFNNIPGLRIFVFSPNEKISRLCVRSGFRQLNYEVFTKES